ncbi:tetratricopeptide repeat protein [Gorillibacterium timonense]|uniref:tetratricopeptide repeat protein n=1 Tax=Gorillibacterium timonense TaxID=1689269 RepID=UPI00071D5D80|nr:tetratricopeptide repeat protein [Gorillibacterium timonense]
MKPYDKGDQLYSDGKFSEAANVFRECIDLGIDLIDSMNYLGCCEMQLGNYEAAHHWLDKAISLEPVWERLYTNKSRIYMKQGNDLKAKELLDRSLELHIENEDTLYYLGLFHERQGDLDRAREAYKKSLEIDPNQSGTLLNYGVVEYRLDHKEEAKSLFERVLTLDSKESLAYWNLSQIYIDSNRYTEAIIYLNQYIELNEQDREAIELRKELEAPR